MKPNLTKLRALVAALREPMPAGFLFDMHDYHLRTNCGTVGCAWGLAVARRIIRNTADRARPFGLSSDQERRLFRPRPSDLIGDGLPSIGWADITPTIQADRIERFIRECEAGEVT